MTRRTIGIIVATALTLAACGGDDDAERRTDRDAKQDRAASSTSDDTAEGGDEAASASSGDFTAPGTELGFGESATVPFVSDDVQGALEVTVTDVTKGKAADLAPLDLGDRVSGQTPYYVRISVKNASGSPFAFTSLGLANPILDDGEQAQKVSVIGDFAPCDSSDAGEDFTTAGASYETCELGLAGSGSEVVGLEYVGSPYEGYEGAPDYSDDPIVWKR